jgi:hypothetical protein
MPAIRHYVITETKEVSVSANTLSDAGKIGQHAFETGDATVEGIQGRATGTPQVILRQIKAVGHGG